jgi:hypothetical protein
MAGSLEALLLRAIDYAGLFPPASLSMDQVQKNYANYQRGPYARFLNRLIVPEDIRGDAEHAGGAIYREALDPAAGEFAKLRTGGLTTERIPSPPAVAAFIRHQANARRPWKATAGLHHPIRGDHALTYAADSPRAVMHGFLNVLMAAAFAWHGRHEILEDVLGETAASAFAFANDCAEWRGQRLSVQQIGEARRDFIHSFGSCSFEEPINDLKSLGLIS